MKNIHYLLFLLIVPIVFAQPKITNYINDYSNIITEPEYSQISSIAQRLQQSGAAEYAIVIVDTLEGVDIESYSLNLAQGVLGDKEKNNGLLLVISMQDKQYRFEVGRGLEPDLPDIVMFRIGTQILEPYFEEENYGLGIFEASKAIESILINGEESQNYVSSKTNDNFLRIFIIIMVFFVIFSFISRPYRGYKHYNGRRKKSTDDLFTVAWIASNILRGGKGGFGGGFGGFSGGSFGGGGFSGKW